MLTPRSVLRKFRVEVDDMEIPGSDAEVPDEDSLWKNDEALGYLDEAQREVVRHTLHLSAREVMSVTAGDPYVPVPEDLLQPRRVRLIDARTVLHIRNVNEMSAETRDDYGTQGLGDWESHVGSPRFAVFDDLPGYIRLVGVPVTDDTVEILYHRFPRPRIERMSTTMELSDTRYERAMLHWMKHLAYRKQDADALDLQRADMFKVEFAQEMARINGELTRAQRRPGTVRYGGL